MKEKRENKRGRKRMPSDPEELAKAHVPADRKMKKQTPTEQRTGRESHPRHGEGS